MHRHFKRNTPIRSLSALKEEKQRIALAIDQSNENLETLVTGIPGKILGNTLGLVAGAVVQGIQNHWQQREEKKAAEADAGEKEKESFGDTLQAVGEETAQFAIAKLIEKLMARQ